MIGSLIGLSFLGLIIAYFSFSPVTKVQEIIPWNQETGKSKNIQSNNDMSLYIEKKRRQTIISSGRLNLNKIKESRTQFGSQTGALECMMTICPLLPCCPSNKLYDGGLSTSSNICILDGNGNISEDGGNALTKVCEI